MSAKEILSAAAAAETEPEVSLALWNGYRLGLLAAVEEIEKTAGALPEAMRGELLRLAVRTRSRLNDLAQEVPHVRPRPP